MIRQTDQWLVHVGRNMRLWQPPALQPERDQLLSDLRKVAAIEAGRVNLILDTVPVTALHHGHRVIPIVSPQIDRLPAVSVLCLKRIPPAVIFIEQDPPLGGASAADRKGPGRGGEERPRCARIGSIACGKGCKQVRAIGRVLIDIRLDRNPGHSSGHHSRKGAAGLVLRVGVGGHLPVEAGKPYILSLRDHVAIGVVGVRRGLGQRSVGLNGPLSRGRQKPPPLAERGGYVTNLLELFRYVEIIESVRSPFSINIPLFDGSTVGSKVIIIIIVISYFRHHLKRSVRFLYIRCFPSLCTAHPLLSAVIEKICALDLHRAVRHNVISVNCHTRCMITRRITGSCLKDIRIAHAGSRIGDQAYHCVVRPNPFLIGCQNAWE